MKACRAHGSVVLALLLTYLCLIPKAHAADDNLLAYRLYEQQDYARAAEIFTDPAWKGIALYRSSQWWRAAEAFVRANDALSAFNLGNCYVKLSYYALALDAYQRALSLDPSLQDAQHNADIMRALLASDEEQQRAGRQLSTDEIERIESNDEPEDGGEGNAGEQDSTRGDNAPGESTDDGVQAAGTDQQAQQGKGGEASEDNQRLDNPDDDGSGSIDGKPVDEDPHTGRPSGGSDTDDSSTDSAAAGIRTRTESEQATAKWLNSIQHDSQLFLKRRLTLEQKRRSAAGQSPPQGGSAW